MLIYPIQADLIKQRTAADADADVEPELANTTEENSTIAGIQTAL